MGKVGRQSTPILHQRTSNGPPRTLVPCLDPQYVLGISSVFWGEGAKLKWYALPSYTTLSPHVLLGAGLDLNHVTINGQAPVGGRKEGWSYPSESGNASAFNNLPAAHIFPSASTSLILFHPRDIRHISGSKSHRTSSWRKRSVTRISRHRRLTKGRRQMPSMLSWRHIPLLSIEMLPISIRQERRSCWGSWIFTWFPS